MIYKCNTCFQITFSTRCHKCSIEGQGIEYEMIPLDPSFYDEFQYQSKGFFKDILGKKKETEKLRNLLSEVLNKYHLLKKPYFQNFIHTSNSLSSENLEINDLGFNMQGSYSQISLFHEVLVREGFVELKEQPNLLNKLLFTTEFSFEYKGFEKEIQRHIKENLNKTITSWIAEVGIVYRDELCFLLYYLWKNNIDLGNIKNLFNEGASTNKDTLLVSSVSLADIEENAAKIYFDNIVGRLGNKLKHFSPERFISMHYVDSLDGFQFEDFLCKLFSSIGFSITETKKTGDQGADLFIERFGKNTVVQAKNYSQNVGNSAVQQVISAKTFYKCDDAMVITNSYFTRSAKELAEASNVQLIDRNGLQIYLDEYNEKLIEEFETRDI